MENPKKRGTRTQNASRHRASSDNQVDLSDVCNYADTVKRLAIEALELAQSAYCDAKYIYEHWEDYEGVYFPNDQNCFNIPSCEPGSSVSTSRLVRDEAQECFGNWDDEDELHALWDAPLSEELRDKQDIHLCENTGDHGCEEVRFGGWPFDIVGNYGPSIEGPASIVLTVRLSYCSEAVEDYYNICYGDRVAVDQVWVFPMATNGSCPLVLRVRDWFPV
jgi:hypothetical protein